ncbi:hypothetical protein HP550_03065 [Cellulomonas humilata]|uniref:Uncharacterized protein n=1 Tax=Cellulomonas humilata TaxID=144055 RepID=A0A7Y5ZY51_9CELL|nr:hypothetical protein [Cellulomonas humilata]NUU16229.1 hypothetical protein [Cellulomonas humilata]
MPDRHRARRALVTALSALALLVGGLVAATPASAGDALEPAPLRTVPVTGGLVQPMATIEDEEEFCRWLTGVYVNHPTYYTVRVYNCRATDVFVKGVYLNGSFGTCVLVPARSSRHLGGSVLKPLDGAQVC